MDYCRLPGQYRCMIAMATCQLTCSLIGSFCDIVAVPLNTSTSRCDCEGVVSVGGGGVEDKSVFGDVHHDWGR